MKPRGETAVLEPRAANTKPLFIAHAAGAGCAPENTLAGVRLALRAGADGVEVDVRASRDGVPILLHDATLERTTDGSGAVADLTLAQIRRLDAGAKAFGGAFRGEPVPTLAEALSLTKGRALLVAEVKVPGLEETVLQVIAAAAAWPWVMVSSFHRPVVEKLKALAPQLACALVSRETAVKEDSAAFMDAAARLGVSAVALWHPHIDETVTAAAHRRGLAVHAWTVDQPQEIQRLARAGIDAIITNDPAAAAALA